MRSSGSACVTAYRSGNVLLTRGLAFGAVGSASALVVRAGTGTHPDWALVALLTGVAVLGGWAGARRTARTGTSRLQAAFSMLLLLVAGYTAWRAMPALSRLTSVPRITPTPKENHHVPTSHLQEVR